VPYLETVAVMNEEFQEFTLFAVNRHLEQPMIIDLDIKGFDGYSIVEHLVLENEDLRAVNTVDRPDVVAPSVRTESIIHKDGSKLGIRLEKASWNVIRFTGRAQ